MSQSIFISIAPQKYLLEKLIGNDQQIEVIIPTNASPHTYQPGPQELVRLVNAKSVFTIGTPFEKPIVDKLKGLNPTLPIYDTSVGTKKIIENHIHQHEGEDSYGDPHIWTSIDNLKIISKNMYEILIKTRVMQRTILDSNYTHLINLIEETRSHIKERLLKLRNRSVLLYHPSLNHFAKDFEMQVLTIEHEGKFPPPKHLLDIASTISKLKLRCAFISPTMSEKYRQSLEENLKIKLESFNPLEYDILKNLEDLANKIEQCNR